MSNRRKITRRSPGRPKAHVMAISAARIRDMLDAQNTTKAQVIAQAGDDLISGVTWRLAQGSVKAGQMIAWYRAVTMDVVAPNLADPLLDQLVAFVNEHGEDSVIVLATAEVAVR